MTIRIDPNLTSSFVIEQYQGDISIDGGSGDISITIAAPSAYAGTYTTNAADGRDEKLNWAIARTRPQVVVAPRFTSDGAADPGDVLTGRPAVWLYEGTLQLAPERSQITRNGVDIPEYTDMSYALTSADYGEKEFGFQSRFGDETSTAANIFTTAALTLQNDPEMAFVFTPGSMVHSGGAVARWANTAANGDAGYDLTVAGSGDVTPTWNAAGGFLQFNGSESLVTTAAKTPLTASLLDQSKARLTIMGVFEGTPTTRSLFIALCQSNSSARSVALGWDTNGGGASNERLYFYVRGAGSTLAGDPNAAVAPTGPAYATGKHIYEMQITLDGVKIFVDGVEQLDSPVDLDEVPIITMAMPRPSDNMFISLGGIGTPTSAPNRQGTYKAFAALATFSPQPETIRAILAAQHGITLQ